MRWAWMIVLTFAAEAQGLVCDELVAREAVVQLDHVHVRRRPACSQQERSQSNQS